MDVMEVVFKSISNANVLLYASMTQPSPVVGVLKASMCGGRFYCSVTDGDAQGRPAGTGGHYKVISLDRFNLNISEAYARIAGNSVISSTRLIDANDMFQTGYLNAYSVPEVKPNIPPQIAIDDLPESNDRVREGDDGYYNNYTGRFISMLRDVDRGFNRPTDYSDYSKLKTDMLTSFDRFRNAGLVDFKLHKAFPRVFFTRPDLNLFEEGVVSNPNARFTLPSNLNAEVGSDSWFYHTYKTDPHLIASLTTAFTSMHAFNPFLSNYASSFDISDERLETVEHGETYTGWKVKYARHNIGSKTAGNFSISYDETNKTEVYKIHKAWVDYMAKVYRGEFRAKQRYITEKRLDYACSVYYFVCGEDGETVLFWSKYIGVFPVSVPSSQFAWSKNDIIKHPENTVEYEYSWKEDCEYASLVDFNFNAGGTATIDPNFPALSIYSPERCGVGRSYALRPFVTIENNAAGTPVVKLKYSGMA